jgi:hypothetical protein
MIELLNDQSADGTSAELDEAVEAVLVAVVEELIPGPAGLVLVSFARPVGTLLEFFLEVGEKQ